MSFGSKLKDMRKSRKMTQKELAEILGLSPNAISNYENAVSFPDEGILQKIFEALSCSPGDLFDVSEKEKPPPGSREAVEREFFKTFMKLSEDRQEIVINLVRSLVGK